MSRTSDIKNYLFPTDTSLNAVTRQVAGSSDPSKNLNRSFMPLQLARIKFDIKMVRDAIQEAELYPFPQRVKMQRLFMDVVLNDHVFACMERRKRLTLLRDFAIVDEKDKPSDVLKDYFRNTQTVYFNDEGSVHWFDLFVTYALEARYYGYSLVSLGDVVNNSYPYLTSIRRWLVSPDRKLVNKFIYSLTGEKFLEDPYVDWHVYISTPSENGVSPCGYGLLYRVALNEIHLRNNLAWNADFNEVFNDPIRKGTTTKTRESERAEFQAFLQNLGHDKYILLDEGQDTVELVESRNVGAAYQSFANFEDRLKKAVSKIILGHADAMDSTPGKLGGSQKTGEMSPQDQALTDCQTEDGRVIENIVNTKLLPRMRKHGFPIPLNFKFKFLNDAEIWEEKEKQSKTNKDTADIALKFKNANLQVDAKWITEQTQIPVTLIMNQKINENIDNLETSATGNQ